MTTEKKKFREVFRNQRVLLPVIHVTSRAQVLENVVVARSAGADGVFLINHAMDHGELLDIYAEVRAEHPDWWIGINCLDLNPFEICEQAPDSVSGIWTDNALVDERRSEQPEASQVLAVRQKRNWTGLYFGGVAFKYQRLVKDLAAAAQKAMPYLDVVATSGVGTGHAADLDKIRTLKAALGDFPLAIASGITPDNITDYLELADCFLVATGVSKSFDQLDPVPLGALVRKIRQMTQP